MNVHGFGWRPLLYVLYVRALIKQLPTVSPALSILSPRPIVFLLRVLPRRAAEGFMLATPLARPEPRFSYIQEPNEEPGPVGTSCCRQGVMGPAGHTLSEDLAPSAVDPGRPRTWLSGRMPGTAAGARGAQCSHMRLVGPSPRQGTGHSGVMDGYRQYEGRLRTPAPDGFRRPKPAPAELQTAQLLQPEPVMLLLPRTSQVRQSWPPGRRLRDP